MIPLETLKAFSSEPPPQPSRESIPSHAPGTAPPGYFYGKFGLVKLAPEGARPPSAYSAAVPDNLMDRLDAYNARRHQVN